MCDLISSSLLFWWRVSLSVMVQTTLNHILICFFQQYVNFKENFFSEHKLQNNSFMMIRLRINCEINCNLSPVCPDFDTHQLRHCVIFWGKQVTAHQSLEVFICLCFQENACWGAGGGLQYKKGQGYPLYLLGVKKRVLVPLWVFSLRRSWTAGAFMEPWCKVKCRFWIGTS